MSNDKPEGSNAAVWRGMAGKCPRCGQGKLFSGYLKIVDECSVCGLKFHGHDVGDGPVVPILMLVGAVIVGLALWVEFAYEPPVWVHLAIWLPLSAALTLAVLPVMKGMAVGLQHRFRSTEEDGRAGGI